MSFLPDKENSVEVLHPSQHGSYTGGNQGRAIHSKSVSDDDVKPRAVRKPLGTVNAQQATGGLPLSGKNKAPLKPLQQTSKNDASKCTNKSEASDLKLSHASSIKSSGVKSSGVLDKTNEGKTSMEKVEVAMKSVSIISSSVDNDEDIEQPAFPSQPQADDYSDLWTDVDRPDTYLDLLLSWRPRGFFSSSQDAYATPHLPPNPSLSFSPLMSSSSPLSNTLNDNMMESPVQCMPEITLPQLPTLDDDDDDDSDDDDDDDDRTINDDLLYFSALN